MAEMMQPMIYTIEKIVTHRPDTGPKVLTLRRNEIISPMPSVARKPPMPKISRRMVFSRSNEPKIRITIF